jgi:GDP/UDP-N,N'-diacetylbacillosamine 2-epimerase (hydrolysing)
MKIGVLTSSRADFGIYIPLLRLLFDDENIQLEIIAFGTHLSKSHGYTIQEILDKGFSVNNRIETLPKEDSPEAISASIGETIIKFSEFWSKNKFDLVFALGDRYEMFAAVVASSTFSIDIAHIAGGETTIGAIDNVYRHGISTMSRYVFTSTEEYKQRAVRLINSEEGIFNVGALNIDNLKKEELFSKEDFQKKFNISLKVPSILITFHPETVNYLENKKYILELISALEILVDKYQLIITMPNTDTQGAMVRHELELFAKGNKSIKLIESFGMKGYLTCMKYCNFMLGNTSSGFVEASFFPKWVINLGSRQKGRINTSNIISIPITKDMILKTVKIIENQTSLPKDCHIYGNGNTANEILKIIKK